MRGQSWAFFCLFNPLQWIGPHILNRLHPQINRALRESTGWLLAVVCASSSRINTISYSSHVDRPTVPPWCERQHSVSLCLWSPPALLASGGTCGWKTETTSCQGAQAGHQRPSRGLRNDDSEGQDVVNPRQPISLWRTMEHLFLASAFTLLLFACDRAAVSGQHMAWEQCPLPLHCLSLKTKTLLQQKVFL